LDNRFANALARFREGMVSVRLRANDAAYTHFGMGVPRLADMPMAGENAIGSAEAHGNNGSRSSRGRINRVEAITAGLGRRAGRRVRKGHDGESGPERL